MTLIEGFSNCVKRRLDILTDGSNERKLRMRKR